MGLCRSLSEAELSNEQTCAAGFVKLILFCKTCVQSFQHVNVKQMDRIQKGGDFIDGRSVCRFSKLELALMQRV